MLDGMNADGAFGKCSSALDGLHFGDTSINEGLVGQVDSPEFKAVALRSRLQGKRNFFACVK